MVTNKYRVNGQHLEENKSSGKQAETTPKLIHGDALIEEGMIMGDRGDFWLTVLESIPGAVLVINLVDRSVKQANYLFTKLWGCDEYNQLTAKYTLSDILANPSEQEQLINQVLCQGYLPEAPILGKKFDGTPVWWEFSCRLMTGEPALGILLVRQLNSTENSSDDQATTNLSTIQSRICQQAAVAYLGQIALHNDDLLDLWDKAVALVNGTLQTKYASILELLPNGQAFLMRAGRGWQNGIAGYATISARSYSQAGYTLKVNQSVVVEDLPVETRFSGEPLLHNHRVISGVSVVISCQTPFNTHLNDLVTADVFA
ncbi:MAG: GAF domain-containing protein, partial [Microcoleaceae cyanobacterium]